MHILAAKSLSTLEICPERAFLGLPQCGKASRCENALVFNFFHDRFGLDGRKIKPLYLTHYVCYLTSNTTRVAKSNIFPFWLVLNIFTTVQLLDPTGCAACMQVIFDGLSWGTSLGSVRGRRAHESTSARRATSCCCWSLVAPQHRRPRGKGWCGRARAAR